MEHKALLDIPEHGNLVKIRNNGLIIDPTTITMMQALANVNPYRTNSGHVSGGKLIIETRGKGNFTIPLPTIDQARKLRDTLFDLACRRAAEFKNRVNIKKTSVDWLDKRLSGDPKWEAERAEIFAAFDNP